MTIDTQLYYLLAMVLSILFPFLLSFDKKINFKQYWKPLFTASGIVAFFFILGDILYTYLGVWGFNPSYHLPSKLVNLPYEEISFFVLIPYCCVFVYEVLKGYFTVRPIPQVDKILYGLAFIFAVLSFIFSDKLYTTATFAFTALILFYIQKAKVANAQYLFLAYAVSIFPFILVNGFLTGMFMENPIVWYNDSENLGIRVITIPIEDFSYSFNLIVLNILGLEFFVNRWSLGGNP